jgi:hypothetical protein
MSSSEGPTPRSAAGRASGTDRELGRGRLCGGGVEVHEVPGAHSSILLEESSLRALAEKLAGCLLRARNGVAP